MWWTSFKTSKSYYRNFLCIAIALCSTWCLTCKSEHTAGWQLSFTQENTLHLSQLTTTPCNFDIKPCLNFAWIDVLSVFTEFQRTQRTRCLPVTWVLCLGQHYCALWCLQTCQCLPCWRPVTKLYLWSSSSHTMTKFLAFSNDPVLPLPQSPLHLFQTPLREHPILWMCLFMPAQNMTMPPESVPAH